MPEVVTKWLVNLGLGQYASSFIDNDIETRHLAELTNQDLRELGISSLGHRKTILAAIKTLDNVDGVPDHNNARLVGAERRQLTVMFCDLVGSTEMSRKLDPEELRHLIVSFQGACSTAIKRFDGYVAQYLGDGILAYFGFPVAHEDDAERAVRSGLDVVEEVATLDLPYNFELAVRVGIATGTVVVGDILGNGASEERTALGETPNLAARLQSIAPSGGVIISETTHRLVEGRINVEALQEVILKGFSEPVQAYRVISIQTGSRFEAATAGGMTTFVGRDIELNLLTDRWQKACSSDGQVVLMSGEAGIGKSRIFREFREKLGSAPYAFVRYQCSSYGANTEFLPIVEQFRVAVGFTNNDSDDDRLDKLEKQVRESTNEAATALLAALLSLPVERYPNLVMSAFKQKLETISVLVEQFELLAQLGPVLMLVEDIHWIDPSSLEVFDAIVDRARALPVLIVVTHRPEFNKRWLEYGHVTHNSLKRLSRQDGRMLANLVTGERKLPEIVLAQILKSTDGVPLFVEELVKTVLESGVVREAVGGFESDVVFPPMAIPTTLKDSLMARLDKLSAGKEIAQAAACIGREFSSALLGSIIGAEDLDAKLAQLLNAGLILRRGSGERLRYIFKHALVQDTAHESLLVSRRKQLHARIAQVLANSENSDPVVLAHHFATAEIHDKAAENYLNAGHRSLRLSALTEAVRNLELGLKEIEAMDNSDSYDNLELDIRVTLGTARMALFGWPHTSVADALERAFDLAVKLDRRTAFGPILWGLCVHYWTRSEFKPTLQWLDKLETIADEVEDCELSAVRDMSAGCQYFWQAEYQRARGYTTHLRGTYNKKEHAHIVSYSNHDPLVFSLIWAGGLLEWITGYPDRGLELAEEAVMLAASIGHPFNSAFVLTAGNECLAERGETKRLLEYCDKADKIIEQEALGEFARNMMSNNWRGRALILQGEFESGYAFTRQSNLFWKAVGGQICSGLFWSSESLALHGIGRLDEATLLIEQAIDYCRLTGDRWMEPELLRIKGEFLLGRKNQQSNNAEKTFIRSIALAREQGAKSWELRTAISLAEFYQSRDKKPEARQLITPIYEWFREGFDTSDLRQAKSLLEQLS